MDDISKLLALVEAEEDEVSVHETEHDTNLDVESSLEDEYAELERKMKEIREKMERKKLSSSSGLDQQKIRDLDNKSVQNCSFETSNDSGSAFLTAFGQASFLKPKSVNCSSKVVAVESNKKGSIESCNIENEPPPQKKRRVANMLSNSPHPFIESSRRNTSHAGVSSAKPSGTNSVGRKILHNGETKIVEIEYYSRLRLKKCFVPTSEMKSRMEGKRFLRISLIRTTMKMSEDCDWVTIGVVSKQLERQAKNGKPFSILNLSDLDDCTKMVSFFIFGNIQEKLIKQIAVGSVIGILNPTIMPPKKDDASTSFSDVPALTVDAAERVMHIGLSADLGWCTATKFRNKQPAGKCLAVINKQYTNVCVFHMQSKYKKASSGRSELQGATARPPTASKFKNTLQKQSKNDQFFYGGKLYSTNPKIKSSNNGEPKIKLTKFLADHSDLAHEGYKDLLEKSNVMNAVGGLKGHHTVSGCSETFAAMLASADNAAGSRQFLSHLNTTNKKEKEATKKAQTAAEVLKERGDIIKLRSKLVTSGNADSLSPKPVSLFDRLKQKKTTSKPTTKFITPNDIKKATADMINAQRMKVMQNVPLPNLGAQAPHLGRGLMNGEIELFEPENLPKLSLAADLNKKKAIAKLRGDDGSVSIPKKDPNRVVLQQVQNIHKCDAMKSKILEKVHKNRGGLGVVKIDKEPKASKYGHFSEQEFNKILNSESVFHKDVESSEFEEHEKYFNPLIKKEMMEKKMSETFEVPCKIVSCAECEYTFWGPHERCKELGHHLNWSSGRKKFFQCSNCRHRTTTWKTYPTKACMECGSSKNWNRTSMLRERDAKILDAETLLIRGLEHGKFLNSLK